MNRGSRRLQGLILCCWVVQAALASIGCSSTADDVLCALSCGPTEVDFSVVYARPSSSQQIVGNTFATEGTSTLVKNYVYRSNYHLGYRVGARQFWKKCKVFAAGSCLWYRNTHTVTKLPLPGGVMAGFPPFGLTPVLDAKVTERTRYLAADAEVGHLIASWHCLAAYVFGGARYAHVDILEQGYWTPGTSAPTTTYSRLGTRLHGVGPRLGLSFDWRFCGCWAVVAKLGSSMLYATRSGDALFTVTGTGSLISHGSNFNQLTWALDGKFGLQVAPLSWKCFRLAVEGGVMLDVILDGPQASHALPAFGYLRTLPFVLGGPYGRVALGF